jgi:hypothetical protein
MADGLPLSSSPVVAALLDLLRLLLPGGREPSLPRRLVVEAWRSPYFDWSALAHPIQPGDAARLDAIARYGRVIRGLSQWREALQQLAATNENLETTLTRAGEQEELSGAQPPGSHVVRRLEAVFHDFHTSLAPPARIQTMAGFVRWLETLIGRDPLQENSAQANTQTLISLNIVGCVRQESNSAIHLHPSSFALHPSSTSDMAALKTFTEMLRGLVAAEEAVPGGEPLDYAHFFAELTGAVNATFYQESATHRPGEILVAAVPQARGLPFQAVAVLGMAEGEFPATISEDPFLRDDDRRHLRLEPSTRSAEQEFFYETITRPARFLLLTRPRLSESGAGWLPSPFWDAVRRVVPVTPRQLNAGHPVSPAEAASWPELLESLAAYSLEIREQSLEIAEGLSPPAYAWTTTHSISAATRILRQRQTRQGGRHDGDLMDLRPAFGAHFGRDHVWSISRLETYRSCRFFFFISHVLGIEPRRDPVEGINARQLGSVYHRIFEAVYRPPLPPSGAGEQAMFAHVMDRATPILDAAPRDEGFRVTAWWAQTREEIIANVTRSVIVLADPALAAGFFPWRFELWFDEDTLLTINDGDEDGIQLRGIIDRIDRNEAGQLRVIDYKLAGPSSFREQDLAAGRTLQLPLYALAVETALRLGPVADGFYWHFQQGERSKFTLNAFSGGPRAAMDTAFAHAWSAVRSAREGDFRPTPPSAGCPDHCPAAAFCYHYHPRRTAG